MDRRREGETERGRDGEKRRSTVKSIRRHTDLEVYRRAFDAAMSVFALTKGLPPEERYALTGQIRDASRSVCANIAEGWRKRRYQAAWISKLTDSEGEAAETQTWIQFAVKCGYFDRRDAAALYKEYDEILAMLVGMIRHPEHWVF